LAQLIKSAGANYTLFSSSKATFQDLQEEIAPFTVEEALEIPTHSALNIIRVENTCRRFLAKMAPPPIDVKKKRAWRYDYLARERQTEECSRIFGRPVEEVEADIYQRERILFTSKTR
jgi:hypothetical protein